MSDTEDLPTVVVRGPTPPPPPPRRWRRHVGGFLLGAALGVPVLLALVQLRTQGSADGMHPPPSPPLDPGRRPVPEGAGPLDGLVIYLSAGHGYLLHREHHDGMPIRWGLQRDAWYGIIEDLYTATFVADQLAPRLEAAGATVIALRERDRNLERVEVDTTDPGFDAWGLTDYVADPLMGGGIAARLAPGGAAVWRLTVPADGHWYLYTRWSEAPDQDAQAIYTVSAPGLAASVVVDQRSHGGHAWKLFDGCLPAGTPLEVHLSGSGGAPLSADTVRLGGGELGFVPEPDLVYRRHAAFDVSFAHQWDWLGAPEDVSIYECGAPRSDMRLRPHWVDWASPEGEEAVYLSIHTNGGRGEGAIVFAGIDSDPPTAPRDGSEALAAAVESRMVAAGRAVDPSYGTKGWLWGDYSEISPVHNPLPAILVELAFHDHPRDAKRLLNPRMQAALAEGIVDGVVQWRTVPESIVLP